MVDAIPRSSLNVTRERPAERTTMAACPKRLASCRPHGGGRPSRSCSRRPPGASAGARRLRPVKPQTSAHCTTAAELMFGGEAPGASEDEQGLPFVGRAGKLLETLLGEIGLERAEVFIT